MTIGEKLKAARERRKLTQQAIAEALGVSQPTIHSWESGETMPRMKRLAAVAEAYGLTPKELLTEAA